MPERLQLTKNAQFYEPTGKLTDQKIRTILEAASLNMEKGGNPILNKLRVGRKVKTYEYIYSIKVFPSTRDVHFFSDDIQDRIYSFILILEIDGYMALFRKSCSNINRILNKTLLRLITID